MQPYAASSHEVSGSPSFAPSASAPGQFPAAFPYNGAAFDAYQQASTWPMAMAANGQASFYGGFPGYLNSAPSGSMVSMPGWPTGAYPPTSWPGVSNAAPIRTAHMPGSFPPLLGSYLSGLLAGAPPIPWPPSSSSLPAPPRPPEAARPSKRKKAAPAAPDRAAARLPSDSPAIPNQPPRVKATRPKPPKAPRRPRTPQTPQPQPATATAAGSPCVASLSPPFSAPPPTLDPDPHPEPTPPPAPPDRAPIDPQPTTAAATAVVALPAANKRLGIPLHLYRLDQEEDPVSIVAHYQQRHPRPPPSDECRLEALVIEGAVRDKRNDDGDYVDLTPREAAYLALCNSAVPLTAAEMAELIAEAGWERFTGPLEDLVARIQQALTEEAAKGDLSPFVLGEGCLTGAFSLRHLRDAHLRNAIVPQAYQRQGMTVFPTSTLAYIPRHEEHKWLEVRPSTIPGAGLGLFVRRTVECIPQDTVVAEYQGTLQQLASPQRDHPYGIEVDLPNGRYLLNAADPKGHLRCYAALANDAGPHHCNAGLVEFTEVPGIFVQVNKDVLGGEEIFVLYGAAYWGFEEYPDFGPIEKWAALPACGGESRRRCDPAGEVDVPGSPSDLPSATHPPDPADDQEGSPQSPPERAVAETNGVSGKASSDDPCDLCGLRVAFHALALHRKSCGAGVGVVAPEPHERNWWWVLKGRRRKLPVPQFQCPYCGGSFETEHQRRAHRCERLVECPRCSDLVDTRLLERHRRRCRSPRSSSSAPHRDPPHHLTPAHPHTPLGDRRTSRRRAGLPPSDASVLGDECATHPRPPKAPLQRFPDYVVRAPSPPPPPPPAPLVGPPVRVGPIPIPPEYRYLLTPRSRSRSPRRLLSRQLLPAMEPPATLGASASSSALTKGQQTAWDAPDASSDRTQRLLSPSPPLCEEQTAEDRLRRQPLSSSSDAVALPHPLPNPPQRQQVADGRHLVLS